MSEITTLDTPRPSPTPVGPMEPYVTITVVMQKTQAGYGLQIKNSHATPSLLVTDVKMGSTAASSHLIFPGDVIIRINDVDVETMPFSDAINVLREIPVGNKTRFVLKGKTRDDNQQRTFMDILNVVKTKISSMVSPMMKPAPAETEQVQKKTVIGNGHLKQNGTHHVNGGDVIKNGGPPVPAPQKTKPAPPVIKKQTLTFLVDGSTMIDTLHNKATEPTGCTGRECQGSILAPEVGDRRPGEPRSNGEVIKQAKDFFEQYFTSINRLNTPAHQTRIQKVIESVEETGTYELTSSELTFGAKTAWRNAPRCIGRIQWSKLQVFDARHIRTARGMFEALCNHIKYGTNKGNIRSAIAIFPPRTDGRHDYRVWNAQLIRYAAYKQEDGSIVGDPSNLEFTELCQKLGWKGKGGMFDILPLLLQADGADPEMFEVPPDLVLEVMLKHPKYPWFEELGYRWYALPAVSNMMLDVGGLEFTAIPFNGWYMGTEIGARDFCDPCRYNVTKTVAEKMGLDVKRNASLWRDQAMLEVNVSVLYGFQTAGVTIIDHHSASESFLKHLENENRLRGGCPGDWVWVVPPMSGSLCPVFHQEMLNYKLKPSYEYQNDPWTTHVFRSTEASGKLLSGRKRGRKLTFKELARAVKFSAQLMGKALAKRIKCTILYATETGRSETFAKSLCQIFSQAFDAKVMCMTQYDVSELEHETIVLVVTSTFGNGDPPDNGKEFAKHLYEMTPTGQKERAGVSVAFVRQLSTETPGARLPTAMISSSVDNPGGGAEALSNVRFAVFALGSRAYPSFCAFGRYVDRLLDELGGERIHPLGEGDELCAQDDSFNEWAKQVFKAACETFCMEDQLNFTSIGVAQDSSWQAGKYRLTPSKPEDKLLLPEALGRFHNRKVMSCIMLSRTQLQSPMSDRQTILVRMSTRGQEGLGYRPGDHVGIHPCNRTPLVDAVLARLSGNADPDQLVQFDVLHEKPSPLGPMRTWREDTKLSPVTLREALTRYYDLTTPPSPNFLAQLCNLATGERDRKHLQTLSTTSSVYDEWRHEFVPTMEEVLLQFPTVSLPPTLLLSQLPRLQPRWYSISSSPAVHPGEIHTTILVVNYKTMGGKGPLHHGVCSTWLNDIKPGDIIPCCIRAAPDFHLPENKSSPLIIVGPGTGIAPLRSFWHQRRFEMTTNNNNSGTEVFGQMVLYFGCRRSDQDNLYKEERALMQSEGVITSQHLALSREPGQTKTYVQHLMMQNADEVFDLVARKEGHLYVCGDVSMAHDVSSALVEIIRRRGDLSEIAAKSYLVRMRQSNRFHEDIFGATLGKSLDQRKAAKEAS